MGRALLLSILLFFSTGVAEVRADPIVFIVNPHNSLTTLSPEDLKNYYEKRERRWPDGTPVRFIEMASGSAERKTFLASYIKRTESDVDFYWFRRKLRYGDSMPIRVPSDETVINMVAALSGAIGYIAASKLPKDGRVKVIRIGGPE